MSKGELCFRSFGIWFALCAMGLLAACGGGSGGSPSQTQPTLSSISVTPGSASVPAGLTQQFAATALYSDGSKQDVSKTVTWSSSNAQVATIDAAGLLSGLTSGSTTITATTAGVSGSTSITVTPATLVSIGVTPAAPSIPLGISQQFTATGVYSNNTTQNITAAVTWASSNTSAATISNAAGSSGLASSVATGTSQITASLGGVSSPAVTLTVNSATLVSLLVTPATPSIAAGTTQQFTATGTYSNNTSQNLTTSVTWNATGTATISNAAGTKGLAQAGLSAGTAQITAAFGGVVSPPATLNVTSATLMSIAVTPITQSIAAGTTQQFTATGTYSDNSTQPLTASVTWSSDTPSVATISNVAGTNGLATSPQYPSGSVGTTHISAQLGGVTSPAATLTVTAATLVSLAVTPTAPSVLLGLDQQFTATGTYTDNSTQNLTSSVTWSSATTGVATISNAAGSQGLATALALGTANIGAAVGSGAAMVTATPVALTVGAGTDSVLYAFGNGANGGNPAAGLVQDSQGNLYGTTSGDNGATSWGTVFKVTPGGVYSLLYSFTGGGDGGTPDAGLIFGTDGNLYGTTLQGGIGCGTVFKFVPGGTESVVYTFGCGGDGANPKGGVIQGTDGNFYGTTQGGGANNDGTVYQVTAGGGHNVIYSFLGGNDGQLPQSSLVQGSDGNFYGTTLGDGTTTFGTAFKVTPGGSETPLHNFTGGSDGASPYAGLIQGLDGNFYGVTTQGGSANNGTLFVVNSSGSTYTLLYSFVGGSNDGGSPTGTLYQGSDGTLYGTTQYGGPSNAGTLFEFVLGSSTDTLLYYFTGATNGTQTPDGAGPVGGLIRGIDGNFYGTTIDGGPNGYGTVFKY